MLADFLYLSRRDLVGLGITMPEVIEVVRDVILEQNRGAVLMPGKASIGWKDGGRLNGNAAFVRRSGGLGIKWNAEVPANVASGLPNLSALIIMNDPVTGLPSAVLEGTWITAMRTGAVSAITAHHLAPADVRAVALIGCGVQMRTQLLALHTIFKPREIRIFDIVDAAADRFARQLEPRIGHEIRICPTAAAAVEDADLIVSATKFALVPEPTLRREWVKPGSLLMPIDVATSWEPDAFLQADKFVTDRWSILLSVAEAGHFPAGLPELYAELHEIVAGAKRGRESDGETIVAMNEGMPIEDVALGTLALERARAAGTGTRLPFITDADEIHAF